MADRIPYHPAADLFPMMEEEEIEQLAADIKAHGQRVPIVLHEGQILDGRNRYEACAIAGVDPLTEKWDRRGGSPTMYVLSLNLHRRQLTPSQRGMVAADAEALFAEEAKERQRRAAEGTNAKREDACGKNATSVPVPVPQSVVGPPPPEAPGEKGKARDQAAKAADVSPRYVQDAKKLAKKAPDLAAEVKAGKRSLPDAMKALRAREEAAKPKPPAPPVGARVPERQPQNYLTHIERLVKEADTYLGKVAELRDREGIPGHLHEALDGALEHFNDGRRALVRIGQAERKGGAA